MAADIQLSGGKELVAILDALPGKIATRLLTRGLYAGASVIRDEIRQRAPILNLDAAGRHYAPGTHEPGLLLRSIQARRSRSRNRDEVRAGVLILKEAFYWRFVELGTRRAPAHPFVRPAVDSTGAEAAQAVVDYAIERFDEVGK